MPHLSTLQLRILPEEEKKENFDDSDDDDEEKKQEERLQKESKERKAALEHFYTSLTTARPLPPLRHVRLQHDGVTSHESTPSYHLPLHSLVPCFVAAHAALLVSLELVDDRDCHSFAAQRPASVSPQAAQAMATALLSCHSLRRLRVADWWLAAFPSPSTPSSSSSTAPFQSLESLYVDVLVGGGTTRTLEHVLDAATHLLELELCAAIPPQRTGVPYEVAPWMSPVGCARVS